MTKSDGTKGDRQASSERMDTLEITTTLAPGRFEDFYRIQRDNVFRALSLTLRDRDLAADAVDEAMARAYQHWRSVRGYRNPEGWTYKVGLNWARSRLRKKKREIPGFRLDAPAAAPDPAPADPSLTRALEELPVHQRAVVVLKFYFDWSNEDIAKALGIPAGTVKSRLHRALEHLSSRTEVTR